MVKMPSSGMDGRLPGIPRDIFLAIKVPHLLHINSMLLEGAFNNEMTDRCRIRTPATSRVSPSMTRPGPVFGTGAQVHAANCRLVA
jgi:hypothetical protein